MLYLVLPEPDGDGEGDVLDFLQQNSLTQDKNGLSEFANRFRTEFSAKLSTFEDNQDNKNFSELARGFLTASAKGVEKIKSIQGKVSFLFVRGSMMGVNIFDDQVYFTPYLPKTEDKQCPQFTIESKAPLGRSIERAINGMSNDAAWVFNRSHALAVAFRLWQVCGERQVDLAGLNDIPAWLLANDPLMPAASPAHPPPV